MPVPMLVRLGELPEAPSPLSSLPPPPSLVSSGVGERLPRLLPADPPTGGAQALGALQDGRVRERPQRHGHQHSGADRQGAQRPGRALTPSEPATARWAVAETRKSGVGSNAWVSGHGPTPVVLRETPVKAPALLAVMRERLDEEASSLDGRQAGWQARRPRVRAKREGPG